jgi:type I restriction enzyme R subunit
LRRVRREALTHYAEEEDTSLEGCNQRVRQLINQHIKSEEISVLLEPISILDDRFSKELKKLDSAKAKASRIEHAMSRTITIKMHEDPVFYESLQDRLQRIIEERRMHRIDDVKEFQLLSTLRDEARKGQRKTADALGLDEDSFAVFGLLGQHLGQGDHKQEEGKLRDLAGTIFETLQREAVIDWTGKEDIQREMRRQIKRELRLSDCPTEKIEEITSAIMDLARVRLAK